MTEVKGEDCITLAKLAEQAERYDDMADYMTEFVDENKNYKLTQEQRNLLSVAFKNVVGTRRSSWRILSSESQKCSDETKKQIFADYCEKVVNELNDVCNKVLVSFTDIENQAILRHNCHDTPFPPQQHRTPQLEVYR